MNRKEKPHLLSTAVFTRCKEVAEGQWLGLTSHCLEQEKEARISKDTKVSEGFLSNTYLFHPP